MGTLQASILVVVCVSLLWVALRLLIRRLDKLSGPEWGSPGLNRLDRLNRLFCHHYHRLRVMPSIPLPATGGVVVVANHVSGLDPMLLIAAAPRPLRFVIAREQYERPLLHWLLSRIGCIPVDRSGHAERAFYQAKRALAEGEVVCVFPEGSIASHKRPINRLKRGAVVLADLAKVPILPIRVSGVGGQGLNLPAIVIRSQATLAVGETLDYSTVRDARFSHMQRHIRPDLDQSRDHVEHT